MWRKENGSISICITRHILGRTADALLEGSADRVAEKFH